MFASLSSTMPFIKSAPSTVSRIGAILGMSMPRKISWALVPCMSVNVCRHGVSHVAVGTADWTLRRMDELPDCAFNGVDDVVAVRLRICSSICRHVLLEAHNRRLMAYTVALVQVQQARQA